MNAAPERLWDFAPVQAAKKLWERQDLALFNAEREAEDFNPRSPSLHHAMLFSDPKGEITISDNLWSKLVQAQYDGNLPLGRYRTGPHNITAYSAEGAQKVRFWSTHKAPYLLADLPPDRIDSFASIVATATKHHTLHGYNEKAEAQTKQQLLHEFGASEHEWSVIYSLLRLTNELAAQLQVGCRKGLIETCDFVHDFEIRSCVTSESAIAYMRSISACNIQAPIGPRAKINWKTDKAALRQLWDDYHRFDQNKTLLAKQWNVTRAALDHPLKQAANEFGYRPKNDADGWTTNPSKQFVKGHSY